MNDVEKKDPALPANSGEESNARPRTKKKESLGNIYAAGFWKNNPTLVMLLGMCPTLAVTGSAENGLGMGLATMFVLTLSNSVISIARKVIPEAMRIPAFIVLIATFVTVVDLLMQAYTPGLSKSLGIFIPLIVVNCIILGRAEAFASRQGLFFSINDGIAMGAGFTIMLVLIGSIRELVGAGSIFGHQIFGEGYNPALVMILPPGAFLTVGYLVALHNYIDAAIARKKSGGMGEETSPKKVLPDIQDEKITEKSAEAPREGV